MPYVPYCGRSLWYQEAGEGPTLIFLHGNTASSRLFEPLLPLYTPHFRCVLLDFLGNGRSDRVASFPTDLWQDQARQVLELIREAGYERPCLLGTSGGAWAAMNAALLAPGAVGAVVADSFDGSALPQGFGDGILRERQAAKGDEQARGFYEWCQGEDWETVVDLDTQALVNYERKGVRLFHRPIETIQVPLLITVSRADRMLANDMEGECRRLCGLNPNIHYKLYETGEHPLILSRAEELAGDVRAFLVPDGVT